ncbi:MAG: hypothetical protein VW985_00035 [Gammaproteobacteria bacterium]
MHESGLIRQLLQTALNGATEQGGELRGIHIRLGVLAGGSADHLREHFEQEISQRNLGTIALEIVEDGEFLGGIEIESIELTEETS